ncbi:hypothetical protein J2Z21_000984 [Streptomyces griseochromogenes]|uniref:Secreted protein n=1 Tax=Streptomyces griseochromogenes TaxID=68214 RepID=A0A1B1AUQ9_9ACTN|nr:hypothetical protein [Streptomyces griseochromogenes]ANP50281.1 hypothetical protein AVL59_12215 [Streptomyces griseochromogenes]MBP2048060.1 hypothetical protein [Streptomyces griseochromogenes]
MKHRGRHRRRRRGAALRAVLAGTALALTAAATLISASQAGVAENPGALKPLTSPADTGPLRLQEHLVPAPTLNRLAASMGHPVGVDAVLKDADRTLREGADCTAEDRATLPVTPDTDRAYCWDRSDATATAWRPASVTTSGDADDDGVWGTHRVILTGWTHSTTTGPAAERGLARVAFVDADDPSRPAYRWVLLVVPVDGGRDYRGLASRISGMVWHQDKLLVTTTSGSAEALYVYDLDRIQRTTVDGAAIGRVPGGWSADGYRYVMPAVGSYRFAAGRCTASGPPCPGALSLDRGTAPDTLVAGEWTAPGGDRHSRLWRYAFSTDPARTGLLAADGTGRVDAVEAYRTHAAGIRGVLSYRQPGQARPSWYVGRPSGSMDGHGGLWRQDTEGATAAHCGSEASHHCWAASAGSLSYWQGTGEVWSLSDRMLFAMPLAALDRSLG